MFQSIGTKERLVDRVVGEIQRQILENKLPPGTMLPSERSCASSLALAAQPFGRRSGCCHQGLLETRPGWALSQIGSNQISESIGFMLNQDKT
jgi:DNA-binding transcriptional MocR family regulator